MNRLFYWWIFLAAAIFVQRGLSIPTVTEPTDEDEDEFDEDEDSSEADDDGRIYKNPRNSPSTECPRDEEQATLLAQKCLRKCSSDEDCKSKKKKCLCDGPCGMSCIKPDRECPDIPQPDIGAVTISGREFGGRATYTCPHGYHVVGLQSRLCRNGHWTGVDPVCTKNIYCLTPPTIDHARHSALPEQATFDLDSTVQYHCHTGYVTAGFPRSKCLAIDGQANWYGPDIQCEPRSCGQPTDPSHGWHAGECYTFGCRITYHCSEGYDLVGKSERFCQAQGDWSPKELPTCVHVLAVQCQIPENPKNGKAIYTSVSYNSIVSYECSYGYTLIGESSRRCVADRKWSGQLPACKEINCGPPGTLFNGWLENIEAGTGLGASIIFRCHQGMLLAGNTSTVCQIDGQWRYPVPECLAPCVVPTISQGTVIPIEKELDPNVTTPATQTLPPTSNKVQHGTTLDVICEDHYEFPISASAPPTCNNGTWSIIPRCTPARCKGLPRAPKFGMVLAPKTEHGMRALFKCKDGFKLVGPTGNDVIDENEYALTCSFGNWTGETPLCQEVYCSFPGTIDNGKVLLVGNMGLYDYRPYVKKIANNKQIMYDCDKGFILGERGPPGATCVGGLWRPTELPSCLPGLHPRLRWNRRKRSLHMRVQRSQYLLRNIRQLQRKLAELMDDEYTVQSPELMRAKRSSLPTRRMQPFYNGLAYHDWALIVHRGKRNTLNNRRYTWPRMDLMHRDRRDRDGNDPAYKRYFQLLKQNHIDYINAMFHMIQDQNRYNQSHANDDARHSRLEHSPSHIEADPFGENRNLKNAGTDFLLGHSGHPHRDNFEPGNSQLRTEFNLFPIPFPNINENLNDPQTKKLDIIKPYANNTFSERKSWKFSRDNLMKNVQRPLQITDRPKQAQLNIGNAGDDIVARLKSQTVRRRKRSPDEDSSNEGISEPEVRPGRRRKFNQTIYDSDDHGEHGRKGKSKEPCEPISLEPHIRIDIVREGKDPANEFSAGTVIRATCAKEYKLNLQNPNGTAKCVRGRWKPQKPECVLIPCSVPSTERGNYFELVVGPNSDNGKPSTKQLSAFDEVHNGAVIEFHCDDGYNVQGSTELKCWDGNWDVSTLPECVPAPCSLPTINNAAYQGGYRGGLTIAHGSSVTVQCENTANNLPVQMVCALGTLSPSSVQCGNSVGNGGGNTGNGGGGNERSGRRHREEYLTEIDYVNPSANMSGLLSTVHRTMAVANENHISVPSFGSRTKHTYGRGRDCNVPKKVDDAMVYKNGAPLADIDEGFESGTEITFNCIKGAFDERSTWKVVCIDGAWVGKSSNCANGTCIFWNNEPNVVSFYNDLEIREEVVEFPAGATIVSRCIDVGKFTMTGSSYRQCIHSEWTGFKPVCHGLNQEHDYQMEKAPTILFRHQNGPIAQSNDGKLIVYPGATLHMECLWMRRFGNPKWNVSHEFRNYSEGWATDEERDAQLEYRLSIVNAVEEDSGVYTCTTPPRYEHSVEILVEAVNCPEIQSRRGLKVDSDDTKLSSKVHLSCINGNSLIGASELVCLPSGNWSAPLPVCESVECGEIPIAPSSNRSAPKAAVVSREVGGRASFSCSPGYILRGPSESVCLPSGEWSTPFPTCIEVQCENPGAPGNGYAQGSAPYRAGDVVQFNCNPEYMMQGQPIIACQDSGRWSNSLPKCVQACSYPGTVIAGRMSSVKFYYSLGEGITFTCDSGLELKGAKTIYCTKNGKWSEAVPTCLNPDNGKE